MQAFVPATSGATVQRRRMQRVVAAAAQPEGTSRRAALQQAVGLAAALLVSRCARWGPGSSSLPDLAPSHAQRP